MSLRSRVKFLACLPWPCQGSRPAPGGGASPALIAPLRRFLARTGGTSPQEPPTTSGPVTQPEGASGVTRSMGRVGSALGNACAE